MIDEIQNEAKTGMEKTVAHAIDDFASIRTGRANPSLFANLTVEYYGALTPMNQLASFQNPEARTLLITPYDRSALGEIEKTLRNSEVGANPANDGNVIRVVMPELTEERRRDYVKIVHSKAEDGRISIRSIRRTAKEAIEKLVKDGEIGEDEGKRAEKDLEAQTKKATDQIDAAAKNKEAELLQV